MTTGAGEPVHVTPLIAADTLTPIRGGLEPQPQGWHSPGADVVIPNWAFGWQTSSDDIARFATLFTIGEPAVIREAAQGSGANKAHFVWERAGHVTDITIDLRKDEPITLG